MLERHSFVLAAILAAATVSSAAANDKEVRALTIPASACSLNSSTAGAAVRNGGVFWDLVSAAGPSKFALLDCPLPLSNVRIGGTSATKISKFRVTYRDSDANLDGPAVFVDLLTTKLINNRRNTTVTCSFSSTTSGNTSSLDTRSTKTCNVTLQAGSFYSFQVGLRAGTPFGNTFATFMGIDFPQ